VAVKVGQQQRDFSLQQRSRSVERKGGGGQEGWERDGNTHRTEKRYPAE